MNIELHYMEFIEGVNVIKLIDKLFYSIIMSILFLSGCKIGEEIIINIPDGPSEKPTFVPNNIPSGSNAAYDIHLNLNTDGRFQVDVKVNVENTSEDTWNELVFYFIPNIFTEKTQAEFSRSLATPATVDIQQVVIGGKRVEFTLEKDTLRIPLKSVLASKSLVDVQFKYQFTLPENGLRLTKIKGNYHLAQFYPMLATYRDHSWNKEEYRFKGETYHTDFSDFHFTYQLPEGYTIVTTSPNDENSNANQGDLEAKNVKMFFAAVVQGASLTEKKVGHTNIRVFDFGEEEELVQEITDLAADTLKYFEEHLGPYPHDQLDIVLEGLGMEYPGIVTARSIYDGEPLEPEFLKKTVVHEIVHQWFYGIISNDPYHDAWLDEGFTEFATSLYFFSKDNVDVPYNRMYESLNPLQPLPVNLSLDEYENNQSAYIYGKAGVMLWKLFEKKGGINEAERFLKKYFHYYQYKEIDSREFMRFTKYYFNLRDDSIFEGWLRTE